MKHLLKKWYYKPSQHKMSALMWSFNTNQYFSLLKIDQSRLPLPSCHVIHVITCRPWLIPRIDAPIENQQKTTHLRGFDATAGPILSAPSSCLSHTYIPKSHWISLQLGEEFFFHSTPITWDVSIVNKHMKRHLGVYPNFIPDHFKVKLIAPNLLTNQVRLLERISCMMDSRFPINRLSWPTHLAQWRGGMSKIQWFK